MTNRRLLTSAVADISSFAETAGESSLSWGPKRFLEATAAGLAAGEFCDLLKCSVIWCLTGLIDRCYREPISGCCLWSKKEVLHFLEMGSMHKGKLISNADVESSESPEGHLPNMSGSRLKSGTLDFDYNDVPECVTWVFTDPSMDKWTPFIDGVEVPESTQRKWAAAFEESRAMNFDFDNSQEAATWVPIDATAEWRDFFNGEKLLKSTQQGNGGTSHKQNTSGSRLKSSTLNFDYNDVPECVTWVFTDPSMDKWTPFIDGVEVPESTQREWAAAFQESRAMNFDFDNPQEYATSVPIDATVEWPGFTNGEKVLDSTQQEGADTRKWRHCVMKQFYCINPVVNWFFFLCI